MRPKSHKKPHHYSAGRTITIIVLVMSIVLCAYSAFNVFAILSEDASSDEVTTAMRSYAHTAAPEPEPAAVQTLVRSDVPGEPVQAEVSAVPTTNLLSVDFDGLKALNDEICAWIDIPGTDISYPVAQTTDNDYYLSHSADGQINRAGAIFMDARTTGSFTGRNTIIYGHRMNNGTMFGRLHLLADSDYRSEHEYIHIYVPGREYPLEYQIIATWESPASLDSSAYQIDFADEATYSDWLSDLAGHSFPGTELRPDDQILTLSTCVRGDGDTRFIVAARLVR